MLFGLMGVQAQDEVDTSILQLYILEDGEVVNDVLTDEVQTHLFAFNANAGDVVTVSMTQITEELDPFLVLLGPSGEVVASDDDSGDVSLSALISEAELPETGTYFIVVSSFEYIDSILEFEGEATELEYELTIDGITPFDTGSDDFQYFAGDLVLNETIDGYSTVEEPVFYFIFDGLAGQVVDIAMESDEFDTVLHVFAPGGNRIAVNDDYDGETNSAIVGLELPEDGVYLVFATDVFFYNAVNEDTESLVYTGGEFQITLIGD
jgi:hypothetical protein